MSLSAYTSNTPSLFLDFSKGKSLDPRISFARNSVATLFNSNGYIEQVPVNAGRIDHDPLTKACKGLLIEEVRTNLLPASQNLDNATYWTPVRASVLSFSTESPSGAIDAFKLVEDSTAANSHYISAANFTSTANSTWTISIFAKAAERSLFQFIFRDSTLTNGFRVEFNLSNGTASAGAVYGTGTNVAQSAIPIGNGWYRCVMTGTVDAASTNFSLQAFLESTSATLSYNGAFGFGLHMWGAQAEIGAFATSYIPSTVTFTGRTSPGTFFNSSGNLVTASSGTLRTTYTPTNLSATPYLLLEEARTNFIRNNTASGAVTGVIGSGGALPSGWSNFIAPTGLSVNVMETGAEKGVNYINLKVTGTPSNTNEITFYFESAANMLFSAGTTLSLSSWLSLIGTPVNISSYSLRIMSYNGGSYISEATNNSLTPTSVLTRYSINNYVTAVGSDRVLVALTLTPNSVTALDVNIRIGLPQLEVGGYSTSVITTAGGTSTRAADTYTTSLNQRVTDVAEVTTLSPWFNPTEGTLYAEASSFFSQTLSGFPRIAALTDGGGQVNTIQLLFATSVDSANAAIWNGGTSVQSFQAGPAMSGCKVALAYKNNDSNAALNGVVGTTDTLCAIPTVTKLTIGISGNQGAPLCGWVSRIIYYRSRLTDAELPLLTA